MTNIGRNDPCPCGSGKKFKHCHIGESVHTEPSLQEIQLMRDTTVKNLLAQIDIYDNEGMLNHFPNHQTLVRELRSAVKAAAQVDIVRNPSHIPGKQIYNREHLGRLGKIVFAWSIPAVEHLIEVYNLQTQNFYVADLNKFVNSSALKQKKLIYARSNTNPIYVIEYNIAHTIEQWAVDGNHRVAARYQNDSSSKIEGYLLPPELHIKALMYDFMRVAYTVRTNINRAFDYQNGSQPIPVMLPMT